MSEPRRIELTAPQAIELRDIYQEFAQVRGAYERVAGALRERISQLVQPVIREDENGDASWEMIVGTEVVELVEVLPDE